jgi:hypothetical protein
MRSLSPVVAVALVTDARSAEQLLLFLALECVQLCQSENEAQQTSNTEGM